MARTNVIPFRKGHRRFRQLKVPEVLVPWQQKLLVVTKFSLRATIQAMIAVSTFIPVAIIYIILSLIANIGRIVCRIVMCLASLCIFGSLGLGLIVYFGHLKVANMTWMNFWAAHAEFWALFIVALLIEFLLQWSRDWFLRQSMVFRQSMNSFSAKILS